MSAFSTLKAYLIPSHHRITVTLYMTVEVDKDRLTKLMSNIHNDYDLFYLLGEEIGSQDGDIKLINFIETKEEF